MQMPDRNGNPEARDRPTAELLRELSDQTTTLVRKEVALAKAELSAKGKRAAAGAGMFGGAGVFGLYAFGALTACVILALATAVEPWLAALIVAVVYGLVAVILALRGKSQVKHATPPLPQQAVDSTKEDLEWVKTRAKSARS
jgi:lipopolysaccharide export LptBFGC system permease protein LptF